MDTALYWLTLNLLTILILAFYSMEEMAAVSFNKVRLQFYVSQGNKRAMWLNQMLQNPSKLFVTTLIGVNFATFIGSECARNFNAAIGISPDLAPISQVFLVIIFGELAPMFAARRYSEHVALLGVPLVYFSAKVLSPFIWILDLIAKASNKLLGGHVSQSQLFLSHDELQKIFEEQDEEKNFYSDTREFKAITSNIFKLRHKLARHVMTPLSKEILIPGDISIKELRERYKMEQNYLILFRKAPENITGIVFIKDLIRAQEGKKVQEFANPPWFITLNTPLMQILKQFQRNSENVAIVLNAKGLAEGFLTFEDLLDEIFGETGTLKPFKRETIIDQTFDGETTLGKLKEATGIEIPGNPSDTLSSWLLTQSEHSKEVGEVIQFPPYEFEIKETSLLGITQVEVRTQSFGR